jgi:hypothetical protein
VCGDGVKQVNLPTLTLSYQREDGKEGKITLNLLAMWVVVEAIRRLRVEGASQFASFVTLINWEISGDTLHTQPPEESAELFAATVHNFTRIFERFSTFAAPYEDPYKKQSNRILWFTYHLLRNKQIGWDGAALFASSVLGQDITPTAWRLRVGRWAEKQGKDAIELHRRRQQETS